jgi:uncharacterized protein (UPF0335 family)
MGDRAYFDLPRPMELSELDRLEQSVKRAFERVERLEKERTVLAAENCDLQNRLKTLPSLTASNRLAEASPPVSPEQLAQIKLRINRLIERIAAMERNL